MGKIDTVTKEYMRNTKVFADLFNYILYGGRRVINPERLHELDSAELALPFGDDGVIVPVQRFRDELKALSAMEDEKAAYLVLGAELESKVNYAMPVRNMLYDALQYSGQISEIERLRRELRKKAKIQKMKDELAEEILAEAAVTLERDFVLSPNVKQVGFGKDDNRKKLTSDEFLSGLCKEDRLVPVITVVVQFDADKWDAALNLHSMLKVEDPELLSFIPDYKINLISPAEMSDEEINKFHTSLREVLLYIKYSKDKKKLYALVNDDARFKTLEKIAVEVINVVTKSEMKIDESEDDIDMCQAIREMREEMWEAGVETATLKDIRNVMESFSVTAEQAMRSLKVPETEFKKYYEKLNA